MTTGECWWTRLVNSVRLLDDICLEMMKGNSVLLHYAAELPWQDIMLETLEHMLTAKDDSRILDIRDVKEKEKDMTPGEYLMERYCNPTQRCDYWPPTHGSPERFLAQNRITTLNHRFVCLTGIDSDNEQLWTDSVARYLESCDPKQEHAIFLLVVNSSTVTGSAQLTKFRYEDYVSDYDCMMLCLTQCSSLSCSRVEKMYLCEVASNIANNNVELAALIVSGELSLLRSPFSVAQRICRENNIKITNLQETVRMAVWEAQIKLVFPKLERFRSKIIRKYEKNLKTFLPIQSSNNDKVERAADLEIGQLYYICKGRDVVSFPEFQIIYKMREARNLLAHWETLPYDQLKEIILA